MDDSYLIHQSRDYLEQCLEKIKDICERDGIILNEKKCKIINLKSDNLNFLKKQVRLSDSGKIIVRPIKKNFARRKRHLVKQAKQLKEGRITQKNIDESYASWRGFAAKYNSPHHLLKEMDLLYAISRKE